MTVVNTFTPGIPAQPFLNGGLMAVLVNHGTEADPRFAVYLGITEVVGLGPGREAAAEWVAAMGSKETWENAKRWFPGIPEEKYNK